MLLQQTPVFKPGLLDCTKSPSPPFTTPALGVEATCKALSHLWQRKGTSATWAGAIKRYVDAPSLFTAMHLTKS
jgi:hypothetical protein